MSKFDMSMSLILSYDISSFPINVNSFNSVTIKVRIKSFVVSVEYIFGWEFFKVSFKACYCHFMIIRESSFDHCCITKILLPVGEYHIYTCRVISVFITRRLVDDIF